MLAARTGLSPRMIGRNRELARLTELLAGASSDPQVAVIAGEGGVGKTRLVEELLAAVPDGTPVLAGQSTRASGPPFRVLLDALRPVVAGWDGLPADLERYREPAELLLDSICDTVSCRSERTYSSEELLRAAVALVRQVIGAGPGLVVFDDLHEADADSIALFGRLAVEPGLPALIVGSFRPDELGRAHPLVDLLLDIERRRSLVQVSVDRLTEDEVADLLTAIYGRPVPPPTVRALHSRTGGNPFFLEELVATAGEVSPADLATMPLPWSLSEVVNRHLVGLGSTERRVLDAAAVLGHRFDFDLLGAVTGLGEEDLIEALRELVARGVLVEPETDEFTFRHALTHEAVAGELLGRERRRLHEKALVALQERGRDDWAAIASHAQAAGRFDDLVEAARRGAAHHLRIGSTAQALQLAELGLTEAEHDRPLRALAARAAWMTGFLGKAIEHGTAWRSLAEQEGDAGDEAVALRHLARFHWERGDRDRQWDVARRAVLQAEARPPGDDLAFAFNLMAETHMLNGEPEAAIEWAERALATADRLGSDAVRPAALVNKGTALADVDATADDGIAVLLEGVELARRQGDDFSLLRGLNNLAGITMWTWPVERTRRLAEEAREVAVRTGRVGSMICFVTGHLGDLAEVTGDLDESRAVVAAGRRASPALEHHEFPHMSVVEAELAIEADDLDIATALVEEIRMSSDGYAAVADALTAGVAVRRGDLGTAAAALRAVARSGPDAKWSPHAIGRVTLDALTAGMAPDVGREVLAALEGRASAHDRVAWIEAAVRARLLETQRRPGEALVEYERTGRGVENRPAWFDADVLLGEARGLVATGRRDEATERARMARDRLERWPGWRRDRAQAVLADLTRPAPEGAGALTPREREVASLVAEGLTNGDIGERLAISTKTASVHVSNILMKLGMSSRTEIAAWAVRTGLVPA